MKIQDLTQDLCNTLARAVHEDAIRDSAADLETLAREIEWQVENKLIDATDLLVCRTKLARKALAIQQQHIPNLNLLIGRLLAVAGDDAIQTVLAPIERPGARNPHTGVELGPIVSEFVDPETFSRSGK